MARLGLCTLPFSLPDRFLFSSRLSVSSSPSLFFLMSMMLKSPCSVGSEILVYPSANIQRLRTFLEFGVYSA